MRFNGEKLGNFILSVQEGKPIPFDPPNVILCVFGSSLFSDNSYDPDLDSGRDQLDALVGYGYKITNCVSQVTEGKNQLAYTLVKTPKKGNTK